jgi:Suppressor of fused protein (SUFU)
MMMPNESAISSAQHTEAALAATVNLRRHLRQHVGPIYKFTGPDVPGANKVGICIFPPDERKPYWTLCTVGMSAIVMESAPISARNIELLISLPEDWNWNDPVNSWPLALIWTMIELIASDRSKSIVHGQTVKAKGATIPIFSSTERPAGGVLFGRPVLLPEKAWRIVDEDFNVRWLAILPLFAEEIVFGEKHGEHALMDKLEEAKVSELFDRRRRNTCSGATDNVHWNSI